MMTSSSTKDWLPSHGLHAVALGSNLRRAMVDGQSSSAAAAGPSSSSSRSPTDRYVTMRYNFKPPAVQSSRGIIQPTKSTAKDPSYEVQLLSETGEQHLFSATTQPIKQDIDCILFYDPATGGLVLERLDAILQVNHLRQAPAQAIAPPPNRASKSLPTPPSNSNSPPGFVSLPPARQQQAVAHTHANPNPAAKQPRGKPSQPMVSQALAEEVPSRPAPGTMKGSQRKGAPSTHTKPTNTSNNTLSSSARPATQPPKRPLPSSASRRPTPPPPPAPAVFSPNPGHAPMPSLDFADEPDEEILDFGKPAQQNHVVASNALHLSTTSSNPPSPNSRKRKFDEISARYNVDHDAGVSFGGLQAGGGHDDGDGSDPDEEELEFGKPTTVIKRVKHSHSPATTTGSPATGYGGYDGGGNALLHGRSPLGLSLHEPVPSLHQQPGGDYYQHQDNDDSEEEGQEESDSDSEDSDDDQPLQPHYSYHNQQQQQQQYNYYPTQSQDHDDDDDDEDTAMGGADADGDEDEDFLMAALGGADEGVGGTNAGLNGAAGSDDESTDDSDYDEH